MSEKSVCYTCYKWEIIKKKLFVVTANEKKPETYTLKTKRIYIHLYTQHLLYILMFLARQG